MRLLFFIPLIFTSSAIAQEKLSEDIRLNQIGFYPNGKKIAIVTNEAAETFQVMSPDLKKVFFNGKLSKPLAIDYSTKKTRAADFSTFTQVGTYVLLIPGIGYSYPFDIKADILEGVAKASARFFYYQRFSTALGEAHAGKWARRSSPSHTKITIHPSAASTSRKEGTIMSSPRGWIDAGDYNKYIVNSGITTATLLSAYEDFPEYYDHLQLNIPESNNKLPDIIDETLWNLRWMLTMQDPTDGGVYHKCTTAKFSGMIQPDQETSTRYVVQKSTGAALNLAAVAAQASHVLRKFEQQLPGLADSCLSVSKAAWEWAKQNPNVLYDQKKMNDQFDPDVLTGEYGDRTLSDEWIWAAAELFGATKDESYLKDVDLSFFDEVSIPTWNQVRTLGYYRLAANEKNIPDPYKKTVQKIKEGIIAKADAMVAQAEKQYYKTVIGSSRKDFVWGSNAVAGNQSILLLKAYRIQPDKKYLDFALANVDYILGRNATGYSFVTGHGDKTPMHPHHRPSESDGIVDPIPGMLAGGPNPGMQDKCKYASSVPDEAYVDDVCSYASNEVAINWNAPLVYITGALEALQKNLTVK
jgi:endoglucanase